MSTFDSPVTFNRRSPGTGSENSGLGFPSAHALVVEAAEQTFDTKDMQNAVRRYAEGGADALKGTSFRGE
jgi:hypothetical protein